MQTVDPFPGLLNPKSTFSPFHLRRKDWGSRGEALPPRGQARGWKVLSLEDQKNYTGF